MYAFILFARFFFFLSKNWIVYKCNLSGPCSRISTARLYNVDGSLKMMPFLFKGLKVNNKIFSL